MGLLTQSRSVETQHGTRTVQLTQLPAMRSAGLLIKLGKLFAGGLGALARVATGKGDVSVEGAGALLGDLLGSLTPADFDSLTRELLSLATVDNGEGGQTSLLPVVDVLLQGKPFELFKLIGWALQVNYSDFSSALGALGFLKVKAPGAPSVPSST